MTGPAPAVSVIVTSYNHERWVEGALDSVAAQTFRDFELVVMDDASTDGSVARIRAWLERTKFPAITIFNETNLGITAARNKVLACCRGEFVCFLAADDLYTPNKLADLVPFLRGCSEDTAVVYADLVSIDAAGREVPSWVPGREPAVPPEGDVFEYVLERRMRLTPVTTLVRRAAIEAVGGYDESLVYEDYDMWLRLADRFAFRHVPALVAKYRVLPTSLSHDASRKAAMAESTARVLQKWVGRSEATDAMIARQLWMAGIGVLRADAAVGRRILHQSCALRPTAAHRLVFLLARPRTLTLVEGIHAARALVRSIRRRVAGGTP